MLSDQEILDGYWVSHGWSKDWLKPIRDVSDYTGQELLSIAVAKQEDSASKRKKRIREWCEAFPRLKIKMLRLCWSNQELLESAVKVPGLLALDTGRGRINTIEPILQCSSLEALMISGPSLTGLKALGRLSNLRTLSIENIREAKDLSFVKPLVSLWEFRICGSLWSKQVVHDLWPLVELENLQILYMFDTKVLRDRLLPLHQLKHLTKMQCSLNFSTKEFKALRDAVPTLKYGTPIEYAKSMTREELIKKWSKKTTRSEF